MKGIKSTKRVFPNNTNIIIAITIATNMTFS